MKFKDKILRYNKYNGPVINVITTASLIAALFGLVDINWYIALFMYFMYWCVGISITYHRYISHFSFEFHRPWVEKFCILLGGCAGQGDGFMWSAVHRHHHKHSDTEEDPHGPHHGLFKYFMVQGYDNVPVYVDKRLRNKTTLFMFKYYTLYLALWWTLLATLGFLLPFGGGWEWMLMSFGTVPVALYQIAGTITVNATHKWGYRNFESADHATNNWWVSIMSFGEGWHNNHHAKPRKYSFQDKWWEFDLGGFIIKHLLIKK